MLYHILGSEGGKNRGKKMKRGGKREGEEEHKRNGEKKEKLERHASIH